MMERFIEKNDLLLTINYFHIKLLFTVKAHENDNQRLFCWVCDGDKGFLFSSTKKRKYGVQQLFPNSRGYFDGKVP